MSDSRELSRSVKGLTVLVTGAASGMGRATARVFASEGANVAVTDFDEQGAHAVAEEIAASGGAARACRLDVADGGEIKRVVGDIAAHFGGLDIVVNNAGIQHRKPLVEFTTDEWRKVIETNLTSAFVIGREAAKRMIPRKHGKIINIGSLGSELARPTIAPYTAAKGGIKNLTRSMAVEWAQHGIQANAIGPGYMLTDMNEALVNNTDFNNWLMGRIPSKRWGKPDELVGAAIFLASDASTYVNGQIIYVDGGMIAAM